MREIKFRAWDGDKFYRPILDNGKVFRNGWDFEHFFESGDHVMQYTGLKDKNGVEIYEGDIVKLRDKFVTQVTFFEGCFYTVTDGGNYRCGGWNKEAMEVIGNIYENPELIDGPRG